MSAARTATVPDAQPVTEIPGAWFAIAPFVDPDPTRLTIAERAVFDTLQGPRRPREWFAGRMAGRAALRAIGAGAASIVRSPSGAPRLEGPHAENATVALTHGQASAAAIAVQRSAPYPNIGIDWVDARDKARLERLSTRVLHPDESPLIDRDPRIRLVAWGAREAVAKATQTGMFAFGLSHVWLTDIDLALESPTLNLEGAHVTVRWQEDGAALVMVGLDSAAFAAAQQTAHGASSS